MVGFIAKPTIFVSLRGRPAAVAIFKPKVWHPVAKHGSGKRQNPRISNRRGATPPWCFSGSAISRGRKPAFHMRQYLSLGRKPNFTAQPYSLARRPNFTAQRWPCLVPGRRLVPSKIAASGIENTLLAMTKSVGFSEKRNSFQNEMFEKRCSATPCKKTAYNKKRPFSKQNRPNFVSLRGAQRRGNLKVIDVESRSEARERKTTEFPNSDPSRRDTTARRRFILPRRT